MIIIKQSLESIDFNRNEKAVALGNFDGIHLGHQQLISKLVQVSVENNLKSLLFTFSNHTSIISKDKGTQLITPIAEKVKILTNYNLDYLYLMEFNKQSSNLSPEEFISKVLVKKLNTKIVIVGFNFRFGKNAAGNATDLELIGRDYGLDVIVIPPYRINDETVSSTLIRRHILLGDVSRASALLGRYYYISGVVTKGKEKGRELGFPTANINFSKDVIVPQKGVYLTVTRVGNRLINSITNIGSNPTFNENCTRAETHLFDFNQNLYNTQIEIHFIKKIRDEKKFDSISELVKQVNKDINDARIFFSCNCIYK